MARIDPSKIASYNISQDDQRKVFRERLMDRFAAHEWVRVINPDNEPYAWYYLPSHNESFTYTADPMKITQRGDVEAYMLKPGESEVILGENAYVMIEGLYKKMAGKAAIRKTPNVQPGVARSYNWSDGLQQEEFIKQIYLGKESPTFSDKATLEDVKKDLEIVHENIKPGRIRKTPARA